MKTLTTLSALLTLGLLVSCGGGGGGSTPPPTPATGLSYTDPASGNFKLVKNTGLSTASHLVLDLVGPAAANGNGFALFLSVDSSKATWSKVASADVDYAQNGTVFTLGTGTTIFKAKVTGNDLQVGLSEKGNATGKALNGTLCRVALNLNTAAGLQPGAAISLTADATKNTVLYPAGTTPVTASVPVAVGTLTAQ